MHLLPLCSHPTDRCGQVVPLLLIVAVAAGASPASAQGQPARPTSSRDALGVRWSPDAAPSVRLVPDARSLSPRAADTETKFGVDSTYVDPGRAVTYSLGGTLLLTPIFGTGLIVGPAFGHFYADDTEQAWRGIKIRTGCVLVPTAVWGAISIDLLSFEHHEDLFLGTLAGGASIVLWSALYDILTAGDSAREMNAARRSESRLQVTPTVFNTREKQVGVAIRVHF